VHEILSDLLHLKILDPATPAATLQQNLVFFEHMSWAHHHTHKGCTPASHDIWLFPELQMVISFDRGKLPNCELKFSYTLIDVKTWIHKN
jgi:hypothetical protein